MAVGPLSIVPSLSGQPACLKACRAVRLCSTFTRAPPAFWRRKPRNLVDFSTVIGATLTNTAPSTVFTASSTWPDSIFLRTLATVVLLALHVEDDAGAHRRGQR